MAQNSDFTEEIQRLERYLDELRRLLKEANEEIAKLKQQTQSVIGSG